MKTTTLSYDIFNTKGQKVSQGTIQSTLIPEEYSGLIAQAIRVYKENTRQRNASTKTRGEVAGSTRKIYRQKGTGKARHGDIRAPIFVGGGIVFGPRPFEKKLKFSKKMAKKAFEAVVLSKIKNKEFIAVEGLTLMKAKTKLFNAMIKKIFPQQEKLLFINNGLDSILQAGRNIEGITMTGVSTLNTYDVLTHSKIAIQKESIDKFFKRLNITSSKSK